MMRFCGLVVFTLATLGCVANANEDPTAPPAAGDAKGEEVALDQGLKSRVPSTWKMEKPSNKLRAYQFRVPKFGDDKEDAELTIFFFGPGGGGDIDDNVKRWKGFFVPPKGKTIDEVAKVEKFKVGDVQITYLDVQGTYLSKNPPFDPNAKVERKENFRRFGVVFDSKNGPYFITLTGPAKTLEHHKAGFDGWLKAFK